MRYRGGTEQKIRQYLIDNNDVDAIVADLFGKANSSRSR